MATHYYNINHFSDVSTGGGGFEVSEHSPCVFAPLFNRYGFYFITSTNMFNGLNERQLYSRLNEFAHVTIHGDAKVVNRGIENLTLIKIVCYKLI